MGAGVYISNGHNSIEGCNIYNNYIAYVQGVSGVLNGGVLGAQNGAGVYIYGLRSQNSLTSCNIFDNHIYAESGVRRLSTWLSHASGNCRINSTIPHSLE